MMFSCISIDVCVRAKAGPDGDSFESSAFSLIIFILLNLVNESKNMNEYRVEFRASKPNIVSVTGFYLLRPPNHKPSPTQPSPALPPRPAGPPRPAAAGSAAASLPTSPPPLLAVSPSLLPSMAAATSGLSRPSAAAGNNDGDVGLQDPIQASLQICKYSSLVHPNLRSVSNLLEFVAAFAIHF